MRYAICVVVSFLLIVPSYKFTYKRIFTRTFFYFLFSPYFSRLHHLNSSPSRKAASERRLPRGEATISRSFHLGKRAGTWEEKRFINNFIWSKKIDRGATRTPPVFRLSESTAKIEWVAADNRRSCAFFDVPRR